MALAAFPAVRTACVCLAASLGLGSYWRMEPQWQHDFEPDSVPAPPSAFVEDSREKQSSARTDGSVIQIQEQQRIRDSAEYFELHKGDHATEEPFKAEPQLRATFAAKLCMRIIAKVSGPGRSLTVLGIVASIPLDCLIVLLMCGWRRRCSNLRAKKEVAEASGSSIAAGSLLLLDNLPMTDLSTDAVRNLADDLLKCSEAPVYASAGAEATSGLLEQNDAARVSDVDEEKRTSKRRSAGDFLALMEKKRDECHILASTQELGSADATLSDCNSMCLPKCDGPTQTDAVVASAPGRRHATTRKELHDWMSRLRQQCEVSENSEEFVPTDAKADLTKKDSFSNKENNDRLTAHSYSNGTCKGKTSNRELRELMGQKRDSCYVFEATHA